ncbi:MAG: ATP-binding cassette domain-containing protein [Chloroflexota bacterium]
MVAVLHGPEYPSLAFTGLVFSYPRSTVLGGAGPRVFDEFSWATPAGATVILGPNGAGKTTLLSLGATALRPTGGSVRLGEHEATRRRDVGAIRRAVGWMPQHFRAIPGTTAREQVAYAGWLKGMSRADAWHAAPSALEKVGLTGETDRRTAQLSGGQQRRVSLAQLLVHRAQLLLLDEPTAGLDPGQRARFRETVRDLARGVPVVVSTHQVDDLTDLFDTVVVLDHGQIRFQGTVTAFMALAPGGSSYPAEAAYATLVDGDR